MTMLAPFSPEEFGSFVAGWLEGWDAHAEQVSNWLAPTVAALSAPTQAELARARQCDNQPCRTRCRRCSKCIRFEQAFRNRQRYGSDDYPGVRLDGDQGLALRGDAGVAA